MMRLPLPLLVFLLGCAAPANAFEPVGDFGENPGQLLLHELVPAAIAENEESPALVLLLHGCTQDPVGFAQSSGWRAFAEEGGFILALAEQPSANNPSRCFNWFLPEDHARGSGEARSLASMVEHLVATRGVDEERVFIAGVSSGGAMSVVMLAAYPELFAAGASVAGVPYRCATDVNSAFSCMQSGRPLSDEEWGALARDASEHEGPWPRLSIWHGESDNTVAPVNAEALEAQWRSMHGLQEAGVVSAGESFERHRWGDVEEPALERYSLAMGHGVAIDADEGCGAAASFVLDVGVCSTEHIGRFFGLLPPPGEGEGEGEGESEGEGEGEGQGEGKGAPGCSCSEGRSTLPAAGAFLALPLAVFFARSRRRVR